MPVAIYGTCGGRKVSMWASEQEFFNAVCHGLAKQGWRKSARGSVCVYRNPEGLGCAIGCLMSDEEAREADRLEWLPLGGSGKACGPVGEAILGDAGLRNLARWAQRAHDNALEGHLRDTFVRLAKDAGLAFPEGL